MNVLLEQGIERLVDTRINPISRIYGYHKSTLSTFCSKLDIEYVHFPELGVPSEWRQDLETDRAYQTLFHRYQVNVLDKKSAAVEKLASLVRQKPSALLCREHEPDLCHRSHLAEQLATVNGLPILELDTTSHPYS